MTDVELIKFATRPVYATLHRTLRYYEYRDIDDFAQESFLRLLKYKSYVLTAKSQVAAVARLVRHAVAKIRRVGAQQQHMFNPDVQLLYEAQAPIDEELFVTVDFWLSALTKKQARVMRALFVDGLNASEAARALDLHLNTVQKHKRFSLETLRRLYGPEIKVATT